MRYNDSSIFLRPATSQEVRNIITALDSSKATGGDGFPIAALKKHQAHFSDFLSECFNDSVSYGSYPACLKKAIVYPIFKGGNSKDPTNYRPISVLSSINKVFEKLIYNRLFSFLTSTGQLYQHQFGFREGSSTEGAVLELIDEISLALDRKLSAGALFLDLSKAFDCINHIMLLGKLDAYGIRGLPNELLESYLSHRSQQVVVAGRRSEPKIVRAGVPQGSNIGPLLFLIFVNDFANLLLRGKPRLFADDTAISYAGTSSDEVVNDMAADMRLIFNYLGNNLLALNLKKTKLMMFGTKRSVTQPRPQLIMDGQIIEEVQNIKYLGVYLDCQLRWDVHIRELISSCSSLSGILRKLSKYLPQHVLLKIYYAFIHSRYQYAIAVWGNAQKTHLKDLQVQQNRCLKAIFKLPFLNPTCELYTMPQHRILPIYGLFTQRIAVTMFRILHNHNIHHNWMFRSALHHHNTRQAHQVHRSQFRTEIGRKRFTVNGPYVYNKLPDNIKQTTSVNSFKRLLSEHIRNNINNFLLR